MDQKYINLYDEYTHTTLGRSAFIGRLAKLAGGVAAAQALLPLLDVNYLQAGVIGREDSRIITARITYPAPGGDMQGYLARPTGDGRYPAVVVIHENRGLNPHIEDVARRAATAGFLALAPDALSPLDGTPEDRDEARRMIGQLDREQTLQNYLAAAAFLRSHTHGTGKVGCFGFCWGGGMANRMAVHDAQLQAAVAFYGRQAPAEDVPKIKAALLLHYAGLDRRINAGIKPYEVALKEHGIDYTLHIYPGVNHAFHNDTAPSRYDEKAAKLAWERTLAFLGDRLK